jgi:hypothetical protein
MNLFDGVGSADAIGEGSYLHGQQSAPLEVASRSEQRVQTRAGRHRYEFMRYRTDSCGHRVILGNDIAIKAIAENHIY